MDDLNGIWNFELLLEVNQAWAQTEVRDLALDEEEGAAFLGEDKIHLSLLFIPDIVQFQLNFSG